MPHSGYLFVDKIRQYDYCRVAATQMGAYSEGLIRN